jgi:hypothetical protein
VVVAVDAPIPHVQKFLLLMAEVQLSIFGDDDDFAAASPTLSMVLRTLLPKMSLGSLLASGGSVLPTELLHLQWWHVEQRFLLRGRWVDDVR